MKYWSKWLPIAMSTREGLQELLSQLLWDEQLS